MNHNSDHNHSDHEIIAGIRKGAAHRQYFTQYIFDRNQALISLGMNSFKLEKEDVSDIYSDSVIAICMRIGSGRFDEKKGISEYLSAIFKDRCNRESKP